jgi:hypothetical protein
MRIRSTGIGAALLTLAVLLLGGAPASAAPSWSAPVSFGPTGRESAPPEIAIAPDGEAVLAWEGGSPNGIRVSSRPPGGNWSPPVILAKAREAEGPHVAVSARKAVIVWSDTVHTRSGETSVVMAATRLRGKRWGRPRRLSASKRFRAEPEGREPQVAMSRGGKAIAIWQGGDEAHSTTSFIGSATQAASGTGWSAPVGIRGSYDGESPELGASAGGEAAAIWSATYDEESAIEVASRPASGPWSGSKRLGRPGAFATPQLAVTSRGEAIGAWVEEDEEAGSQLQVATRKPGGRWKVRPLGPKGEVSSISIVTEPGGGAKLVWVRGGSEVVTSTRSPTGGWTEPASLAGEGLALPEKTVPEIAVSEVGESLAVWQAVELSGESSFQAASRPPGGPWAQPETISVPSLPGLYGAPDLQVAIASAGEAFAVWRRHDAGGWQVEVATRPAGAP